MDPNTQGGFSHRTRENKWCPFLPCLQWTLCHPFMANQCLPGKHGMCVMRSQKHLLDSANVPLQWRIVTCRALARFAVLMYDRYSDVTAVNEARLNLLARKQKTQ